MSQSIVRSSRIRADRQRRITKMAFKFEELPVGEVVTKEMKPRNVSQKEMDD